MDKKQRLVFRDQDGMPSRNAVLDEAMAKLPRNARREIRKRVKRGRTTQTPIAEADIPEGSTLSPETLRLIRGGAVALESNLPPDHSRELPRNHQRPSRQERARQARNARNLAVARRNESVPTQRRAASARADEPTDRLTPMYQRWQEAARQAATLATQAQLASQRAQEEETRFKGAVEALGGENWSWDGEHVLLGEASG